MPKRFITHCTMPIIIVPMTGLEPATIGLKGAGDGIRTHISTLKRRVLYHSATPAII